MSIKRKLAFFLSIIVTMILILNITLNYFSTRELLIKDQEEQMEVVANEIRISIEHSRNTASYMENLIGQQLRTAAIVALQRLDKDYRNVTNEQLAEASKLSGIEHITLFAKQGDDIVGLRSSDPAEINLSTKEWGYWRTALQQLFDQQQVTIPEGQKLPNYWSGPFDVASSDTSKIDKWGYYYDGTTNYIINPYVSDREFKEITEPKNVVEDILRDNDVLLEITGFNPKAFGKEPIITRHNGEAYVELGDRPVFFGAYTYQEEQRDIESVRRAAETGQVVSYRTTANSKPVLKSFMRVNADQPYVIGLVTDYKVVQDVLNQQLLRNLVIAVFLLILVFFGNCYLAGYIVRPLQVIVARVNEMANGNLGVRAEVKRNDELGHLADCINSMSQNLQVYTEELKSLIEHNSAAIFSIDLKGNCQTMNPVAEKLIGYTTEEMRNVNMLTIVADQDIQRTKRHYVKAAGGQSHGYVVHIVNRWGQQIELGAKTVPIFVDEKIVGFYTIAKDITESKKTEEILRKSDKLGVVGQLAAGVAHEIRNPLTAIKGFVQLIEASTDAKREYFEIMLSELDRIEFIINEFLVLAKPQAVSFQHKDLRVLLQNIIAIVDTQAIMSRVQIVMNAEPDLPLIECEENQLKQVFINVLKNSIEAMHGGGTIRIEVNRHNDDHVQVRIVDEGSGIPPERIQKLGEPFYTTKEKGTGLGLMVSYKIINEHQGKINISSELDKGTTVDVILPVSLDREDHPSAT
ncbi:MAG: ATP-binding protein [Tumebacillaceae bacterium]